MSGLICGNVRRMVLGVVVACGLWGSASVAQADPVCSHTIVRAVRHLESDACAVVESLDEHFVGHHCQANLVMTGQQLVGAVRRFQYSLATGACPATLQSQLADICNTNTHLQTMVAQVGTPACLVRRFAHMSQVIEALEDRFDTTSVPSQIPAPVIAPQPGIVIEGSFPGQIPGHFPGQFQGTSPNQFPGRFSNQFGQPQPQFQGRRQLDTIMPPPGLGQLPDTGSPNHRGRFGGQPQQQFPQGGPVLHHPSASKHGRGMTVQLGNVRMIVAPQF